jgi:hypothetical protein
MSGVVCQVSGVRCQMSGVRCQVSDVRCQMSGVRCQVSDVRCQMSGVRCQVSDLWHELIFFLLYLHTQNILAEVFFPATMLTYVKTCNMMYYKFSLP